MSRVPMKGDPTTIQQMVDEGLLEDPIVALAKMYCEATKGAEDASSAREKAENLGQVDKIEKLLAEYGYKMVPAKSSSAKLEKR